MELKLIKCPNCRKMIQHGDRVGVSQIHAIYHFLCGSYPASPERLIDKGTYIHMFYKYFFTSNFK